MLEDKIIKDNVAEAIKVLADHCESRIYCGNCEFYEPTVKGNMKCMFSICSPELMGMKLHKKEYYTIKGEKV